MKYRDKIKRIPTLVEYFSLPYEIRMRFHRENEEPYVYDYDYDYQHREEYPSNKFYNPHFTG